MAKVALINSNRMQPPISPIGLEYVAEAVHAAGHKVYILDLCWPNDWQAAIHEFFSNNEYGLIGITLRNTDDCFMSSRKSFIRLFFDMVQHIRSCSNAPIIAGGPGFSTMPEAIMQSGHLDAGVWGDGEFVFPKIAERIEQRVEWHDLPNLIVSNNGNCLTNQRELYPLDTLPPMKRQWVDNVRYFNQGGQLGIETKRGCPCQCTYCADPIAKGKQLRLRPPSDVVDELQNMLGQGIDHFHTCDSEFNLPIRHAGELCDEIIRRGLGDSLRWYAYCAPKPFTSELAHKMRQAGCVGINFGADHGDHTMLKRLRRAFSPQDIIDTVTMCHNAGIVVMLDLLLGTPGENGDSIKKTIDVMKRSKAEKIGVSLGVRLYPHTEITDEILKENAELNPSEVNNLYNPAFYIDKTIETEAPKIIRDAIGDDPRFFFSDPTCADKDYNYNDNTILTNAIQNGYRGAYWDILRRLQDQ